MIANRYRVKYVDNDAFTGRENHPDASDIGVTVTALKMEQVYYDEEGQEHAILRHNVILSRAGVERLRNPEGGDGNDYVVAFYYCITDDGRLLDLLDYELEAL